MSRVLYDRSLPWDDPNDDLMPWYEKNEPDRYTIRGAVDRLKNLIEFVYCDFDAEPDSIPDTLGCMRRIVANILQRLDEEEASRREVIQEAIDAAVKRLDVAGHG